MPRGRRSSRSRSRSSGRPRRRRTATPPDAPRTGRGARRRTAAAAMTRRPRVEVLEPDQRRRGRCTRGRPSHRARAACRARPPRSTGPGAGGLGQPRGELEHARAEVDADDLVGAEVPERERVAAARALEVDRPPAAAVQVADQRGLDGEQVRATGPDQRDGLVEPALVALGGLVPGGPVRPCMPRTSARSAGVAGRTWPSASSSWSMARV